jgi:hypothetical protein
MGEPIYDIEQLLTAALESLQRRGTWTQVWQVAQDMGVPLWAADRALETAYIAGKAVFQAGAGWRLIDQAEAAVQEHEQPGLNLEG